MKRPYSWLPTLLLIGLVLVAGKFLIFTWLAPRYLKEVIIRLTGDEILMDHAGISALLTTHMAGLRLAQNAATHALTIQRTVVRPRWVSMPSKQLWLESIELERPILRITRTSTGAVLWPDLFPSNQMRVHPPSAPQWSPTAVLHVGPWKLHADSLQVIDGTVEVIDHSQPVPFHGLLDHIFLNATTLRVPPTDAMLWGDPEAREQLRISFAMRAVIVGDAGHAAPVFCSGWADLGQRDLEASCQLEPLPLAAFQPYYHGPAELRVYAATLGATSQWVAKANALTARIQLTIGHLIEGDISVRGRTIVDVKRLPSGPEPRLSGELTFTGPLVDPSRWQGRFVPGDAAVELLRGHMVERGIAAIRLPLFGEKINVSIASADADTMRGIEASAKEISEALEILASPRPEPTPPAPPAAEPTPPATAEPSEPIPAAPGEPATPAEPPASDVAPSAIPSPGPVAVPATTEPAPPAPPSRPNGQTIPATTP